MLTVSNISKTFNIGTINEKTALESFSMTLEKGEFITVIGGNGAGKSTMLNAVAGTFSVDCGSIEIGGVDVTKLPEYKRARYMGRVFQDPMIGTAAKMSIAENLALATRRGQRRTLKRGVKKPERNIYREKLAQLNLGLEDRLNINVGLLSGGQRQALTLLMATMSRPDLLLLDEHTAALDPKTAERVLELSDEIIRREKLTTLMVTHNMKEAITYGDRLVMMDRGQIVLDVCGNEKKSLTVRDLLDKFAEVSALSDDRMLLVQ